MKNVVLLAMAERKSLSHEDVRKEMSYSFRNERGKILPLVKNDTYEYNVLAKNAIINLREVAKFKGDIKLLYYGECLSESLIDVCKDFNAEIIRTEYNIPNRLLDYNDICSVRFVDYRDHIKGYKNIYMMDIDIYFVKPMDEMYNLVDGVGFDTNPSPFPYYGEGTDIDYKFYEKHVNDTIDIYGSVGMPCWVYGKYKSIKDKLDKYYEMACNDKYIMTWGFDAFAFTYLFDLEKDYIVHSDVTRKIKTMRRSTIGEDLFYHCHNKTNTFESVMREDDKYKEIIKKYYK